MKRNKYKIGDRVRIVDDPKETRNIGFAREMYKYCGTIMTIRDARCDDEYGEPWYLMEEDSHVHYNREPGWMWSESWLEPGDPDINSADLMSALL